MTCKCGATIVANEAFCRSCGTPVRAESSSEQFGGRRDTPVTRYRDAYRVARGIVAFGATIKFLGVALGLLIFVAFAGSAGGRDMFGLTRDPAPFVIAGLILGGMVWLVCWIAGVMIGAQGQLLLATLDGTVQASPFLGTAEKASIMSISPLGSQVERMSV